MSTPKQEPPGGLSPFAQQLLIVVLALIFLVLVIYLLREFATVLKPLCIAAFIGYLVIPAHTWLVKQGIGRPLAAVSLIAIIVGLFYGVGSLIYGNIEAVQLNWPVYEQRTRRILAGAFEILPESWRQKLGPQLQLPPNLAVDELRSVFGTFLGFLSFSAVVIVYLMFMLAERASLPKRLANGYGTEQAEKIMGVLTSISRAISEYIAVKTFISILAGVFTTVLLMVLGVDFALTWGTLAFLFNFIPYLGSLVATVLPIFLALVQFDTWWQAVVIGVLLIGMQQSLGVFVEPKMAGAKLGVSPLLIILSLAFWGVIWGIIGMILAVPLLVTTKIILENIPATVPVAKLMGSG